VPSIKITQDRGESLSVPRIVHSGYGKYRQSSFDDSLLGQRRISREYRVLLRSTEPQVLKTSLCSSLSNGSLRKQNTDDRANVGRHLDISMTINSVLIQIRHSVPLFQVETFCIAVGGKSQNFGSHIAAVCHVEWLNLSLASWFL
jgi:hypothetical protein